MLTQEQTNELHEFIRGLSPEDEWLMVHLAIAVKDKRGGSAVENEDKYEIMRRWDEFKKKD